MILILLGVIILSIACINFMNLSTARYLDRTREVGIRKVVGDSDELLVPGHDMEVFRRFPKITERVVQIKLR